MEITLPLVAILFGLTGVTIILTSGAIFESFRLWVAHRSEILGKLIDCPMCTGFWVGLSYGLCVAPISAVMFGGLVSLSSWTIYTIVDYFATKSMYFAVQINRDNIITENDDNVGENNK